QRRTRRRPDVHPGADRGGPGEGRCRGRVGGGACARAQRPRPLPGPLEGLRREPCASGPAWGRASRHAMPPPSTPAPSPSLAEQRRTSRAAIVGLVILAVVSLASPLLSWRAEVELAREEITQRL